VIELAETLVDNRLGPILRCVAGGTDPHPSLRRSFSTFIQQTGFWSDDGYATVDVTGGSGSEPSEAKLAALGEAIERYSLSIHQLDALHQSPFETLSDAVPPIEFTPFSESQRSERGLTESALRETPFYWTRATSLVSGREPLIPAQAAYMPFDPVELIRSPNTSGAAAGLDYRTATARAVSELVERECFLIGYLNHIPYPHVDLDSTDNAWFQKLRRVLDADRRELYVLDGSLDQPYETAIAILVDRDAEPAVCFGLGCDNRMETAVQDAILEVFQIYEWMTENIVGESSPDSARVSSLEDRGHLWNDHQMIEKLDFWLESDDVVPIETSADTGLDAFRHFLKANGYDCYIADVTSSDVGRAGFSVVRAIAPAMYPLYLDEQYRYLGTDRLYDVPVKCGYQQTPTDESEMNTIPHPML
jgi:ribosomal protein S12 methylthiotransferase accessory factor